MLTTSLYIYARSRLPAHAYRLLISMELFSKLGIFNSRSRKSHPNPRIDIAIDIAASNTFSHYCGKHESRRNDFSYVKIIRTVYSRQVPFSSREIHFREAEPGHSICMRSSSRWRCTWRSRCKKWSCNNFKARVICFRVALSQARVSSLSPSQKHVRNN